jgi:hypothetical protein
VRDHQPYKTTGKIAALRLYLGKGNLKGKYNLRYADVNGRTATTTTITMRIGGDGEDV